ncbi:Protein split ends [Operophtera brumata]|uniref:Protein split ends n=1 Tax=Operophtera brumata TaxID=104452 RepID=A0A0L7LPK2_OPEBR|nr:Protein split ends [Operophtera brumata]
MYILYVVGFRGGEDSSGGTTCPIAASAAAPANWRGTNDSATEYCRRGNTPATYGRYQRNNSTAPFSTPPSNVERTTPHNRWYASSERAGATGGESTPSTPGGGTESGRRRRHSGSASSRSDSSSPEPSDTSRASTPLTQPPLSHHNNHRTPTSLPHQWASTASGRPLAICVRNLPTRSTDSSLKDGLYHEYKKHGKVVWVKVVGQNADRYAVVRFKKPSDVEKALEVSQDKLFFGCKISVAPHQSGDDDAESAKPYETDIDEYHPKATRTLFIGNLEKDVTQQQLRDKFKHFGRIIEVDIKKGSGGGAGYAFCQYASISSVVEAIRAMDGEYIGGSRVKLGFGKPVATACVWVDGLTEHTEKQDAFYEQLEKHGGSAALAGSERLSSELTGRYLPSARHDSLRLDRFSRSERAGSITEPRGRPRTPSPDRSQQISCERRSPPALVDGDLESRSRDSASGTGDAESKSSFDTDEKDTGLENRRERSNSSASELTVKSEGLENIPMPLSKNTSDPNSDEDKKPDVSQNLYSDENCARDVMDMILKKVENGQKFDATLETTRKLSKYEFRKDEEHSRTTLYSENKFGKTEKLKKLDCTKNHTFDLGYGIKELIEHELQNHINESITVKAIEHELQNHINDSITVNSNREKTDFNNSDTIKLTEKDRNNSSSQIFHSTLFEKENILIEKPFEKTDVLSTANKPKHQDTEKNYDERMRNDRDKVRHNKAKEKHECDKEKSKNIKNEKGFEKNEKDNKIKEDNQTIDKGVNIKCIDRNIKEKSDRECEKTRHMHHRRDSKSEKDKRKDSEDTAHIKVKKEDKHKQEKTKKDNESKRDSKKESEFVKSRKSSRDESTREISRKDSTDSLTSRASHELKIKDIDVQEFKEDIKPKIKYIDQEDIKPKIKFTDQEDIKPKTKFTDQEDIKPKIKLTDLFIKLEKTKDFLITKDGFTKIKHENDKVITYNSSIDPHSTLTEHVIKPKADVIDKPRHHSVDSPSVDSKRKERLNSCSSLPSNIGHKRRISSQDNFDLLCEESKKIKSEPKIPERRESKDSRSGDRHKTTKFSKGHFAKIIESKTKDDKKNQVKPPDNSFGEVSDVIKDETTSMIHPIKKSPKDDGYDNTTNEHNDDIHNNLDFLALLELRSSEEDETQKALRKEMKEKKRIQQLQQIQELQLQQEVELGKYKEEKKQKSEDKKRENAREKRMSTERKSREDKGENSKRKNRKPGSDSSDSDEPKKHSIFDIIDDGPTYISMYDKVKARSCKNMQKQEEEKRQEKIKAKFSQLKQSRAKREEKKRSSWDEDSDSDPDAQRKKSSLDSSDDDDSITTQNTKRDKLQCSNIEFDEIKTEDYFSMPHDDDHRNKLSRKNSRTRIMSDSSDDLSSKNKCCNFKREDNKLNASDFESLSIKVENSNNYCDEKITKNTLFNLFGKSDSDDSKLKSSLENDNSYKPVSNKSYCNDLSSECESVSSSRNVDLRRKHKKKQKKHKSTYSDEENKIETSDTGAFDSEIKHKKSIKQRRHSSKKDKRKERIRDSNDTDEGRDDKIKIKMEKKSPDNIHVDYGNEIVTNNTKRDGKMEDIFGPLTDESENDNKHQNNKSDFSSHDYDSNFGMSEMTINSIEKEMKRKKEKRRKEKRWFRDDDNSLDVDAVGKAIEANLLTITDDTENIRSGIELKYIDGNLVKDVKVNSKYDKLKRESKEKRKKKKRTREERLGRKDHHYLYHPDPLDKSDHDIIESSLIDSVSNAMLLDIPLPNDINSADDKMEDCKSLSQSPSLPRLTESPPILIESSQDADVKSTISNTSNTALSGDDNSEFVVDGKDIEIEQIPMPPPFENIVQDISEVPLPADPAPTTINDDKPDALKSALSSDSDTSEDAVINISVNENETEKVEEKPVEKIDIPTSKADKKPEEKQRAVISQEETEDAVAALLGESFGGKIDTFSSYEEDESTSTHQADTENTTLSTGNIPEEDAEEMRQAVQNLNACEMEMKPDTPVSDSDLFIDTDTEEADETPQDAIEKLPGNVITSNQLNNNTEQTKRVEEPNVEGPRQKSKTEKPPVSSELLKTTQTETNVKNIESDVKIKLARRENVQIITSTATPVITSWTLTNNKIRDPQHIINIQSNMTSNKIVNESKSAHMTANIVQIKTSQPQNVQANNLVNPIMTPARPPYQVINQIVRPQSFNMQPRPQLSNMQPLAQSCNMQPRLQSLNMQPRLQQTLNMQPPTIKIPEPHILYQKSQGIVISPRIPNDPRMQSPKTSPQADGMTSPRLTNMTILTSTPQNSAGMMSPTSMLQRSPGQGQVTVVRMQQPPLSPIQTLHGVHGSRAMMSPNRPNSVLVQGGPLHYNRLPVTPVLTPISKQINVNSAMLQNKVGVTTTPLMTQHKNLTAENRKGDHGNILGNKNENAKIILSPTSLQHSNNPTVMAQNRLMTMQNAVHLGNINSALHLGNKVVINKMNAIPEKRENLIPKSTDHIVNHSPFGAPPMLHVAASHASSASIIQSGAKSMCNIQESNIINRGQQGSNVIHTFNSQRLMAPVSKNNVIQLDKSKITPSVLSMATMRPATVLTKAETSGITAVTNATHTNVSPMLLKPIGNIIMNTKPDRDAIEPNNYVVNELKSMEKIDPVPVKKPDSEQSVFLLKPSLPKSNTHENISKCETDFEELLKDNTNEIKVTNNPEKKLEVNVGKTTTLITPNNFPEKQILEANESNPHKKLQDISTTVRATSELPQKDEISTNEFIRNTIQNNLMSCKSSNAIVPSVNDMAIKSSEIRQEEINQKSNAVSKIVSTIEKGPNHKEEINKFDFMKVNILEDRKKDTVNQSDDIENQLRNLDEDMWSVKDLNIESVIKKVDSLCNDSIDCTQTNEDSRKNESLPEITAEKFTDTTRQSSELVTSANLDNIEKCDEDMNVDKVFNVTAKRGGRNVRGKRGQKGQERVQTRQISKSSRGTSAKRGRGRAKIDKKLKNLANSSAHTLPGDVYDFHEDSGDETSKSESRPRLILTIKSPLSGQVGVTATSTLSITQKDQNKITEKFNKEEKNEDFVSPSTNTRKSRRLQEKDVHRNVVDDVGEDGGPLAQGRPAKRRATRQTGGKATNISDKANSTDTRKSPRGNKRTRDRSLSEASVESGDGEARKDEITREPKVARLEERLAQAETEPPLQIARPAMQPYSSPAAHSQSGPAPAPPAAPPAAPLTAPPIVPLVPPPIISTAPVPSDGMYPHFSHQHYQMYQHHFRATQHESRATPSPFTR